MCFIFLFYDICRCCQLTGLSQLKTAQIQLLSGGASSIIEVLTLIPLDVVKTRLQLQTNATVKSESHYTGVFDAFVKIYRHEGIVGFWRGLIPPLISDTPRRAVKFMVFEQLKPHFLFGSPKPTFLTYGISGAIAGAIEAVLQNPFEVIKITQQANRKEKLNTRCIATRIYRKHGFSSRGFTKGIGATVCKHTVFHAMYFGFFCTAKDATTSYKNTIKDFFRKACFAIMAGLLGCCTCIPFDVAKSRIQGPQPVAGEIKYCRVFPTLHTIYKEEGLRALYKGLTPQMMRSGPGACILLLTYEYLTLYLASHLA